MELSEALKEIRDRNKPYLHVGMPQSTFANTLRNIEVGLAKQSTIEEFMQRFGYEKVKQKEEWREKSI